MPSRPDHYSSDPGRDAYDDPNLTGVARSAAGLPAPRLWRSRANRVIAGVLGGLAEKYGLEARPLRILYTLLTIASGGLLVLPYVGAWAVTQPHGQPRTAPRLWRSRTNRVIAGVIGGLAEKLDVSATVLRVAFVLLSVFSAGFPGILVYLVLWMITGDAPAEDAGY